MFGISPACKILISALQLENLGRHYFTREQLMVEAWKRYPENFGMRGFESQYPDTTRMLYYLKSKHDLVVKKKLEEFDDTHICLSNLGRNLALLAANNLDVPKRTPTPLPNGMDEHLNAFLERVLVSEAYERYLSEDNGNMTTLVQAFDFWGVPKDGNYLDTLKALSRFKMDMEKLKEAMMHTQGELVLRSGRAIQWKDIAFLRDLDTFLRFKFSQALTLIKRKVSSGKAAV